MFQFLVGNLIGNLIGTVGIIFFIGNTIFWCSLFYPLFVLKLVIPFEKVNQFYKKILVGIAECWIDMNSFFLTYFNPIRFHIKMPQGLQRKSSYLVISNHQSWVDILALQYTFNRKVPFFRFFIKDNLKWVPFLGIAWKLLDYPFMKRKKGSKDLQTASEAALKLKGVPASLLIFLEGTRFSETKKQKLKSTFKKLLPPKVGGAISVLDTLGEQIESLIDVTIVYRKNKPNSFWNMLCGRVEDIWIEVREVKIPEKFRQNQLMQNLELKKEFESWVNELWQSKDLLIESLTVKPTY